MQYRTATCERCGLPRGEGGFCANCKVLNADPGAGLYAASGSRRLAGRLLDLTLFVVCLGVGWWIWLGVTSGGGQSPAKRMLGLRVVRADGSAMGGGGVWFRDGVLALLLTPLLPLSVLWALRSASRQTLHDVLVGSAVVSAEARPATGYARRQHDGMTSRRPAVVLPPAPVARPGRAPGPARSRAPEPRRPTGAAPRGPGSRPVSRAPERSSGPERPHDRLPDDRPMWPGGAPPWQQQGPGSTSGARPPAASRPGPGAGMPPRRPDRHAPPPAGDPSGPIEYSRRATTTMEKIAELEQRYRGGGLSREDFENERRRLIAES